MPQNKNDKTVADFLTGKSEHTINLFQHFLNEFGQLALITLHPAKTMIGIANEKKRIAWVTQFGKNFIHVVFPFEEPYPENLCFIKIAQVPGDDKQFNHHFRMYYKKDINEEVISFMRMALEAN